MKPVICKIVGLFFLGSSACWCQSIIYTNYIIQEQYEDGNPNPITAIMPDLPNLSDPDGEPSALAINPGGARFELWTMNALDPNSRQLLGSTYVSSYMPAVEALEIISEDTTSPTLRTRADRPFTVKVTMAGLLSGADMPDASKSVDFFHYAQSYGEGGDGLNIDRTQALKISEGSLASNGLHTFEHPLHSVPAADLSKARGEQTFKVWTLPDLVSGSLESELSSKTIQIWPVADGTIAGITNGQKIRFRMPQITLTINDLYPISTTYLQAYPGAPALGTVGTVVPGSALIVNQSVPHNRVLVLQNYDEVITEDGLWTFELLTSTPFGIDRLAYVSFRVDRTLDVKASVNTLE